MLGFVGDNKFGTAELANNGNASFRPTQLVGTGLASDLGAEEGWLFGGTRLKEPMPFVDSVRPPFAAELT